MTFWNWNWALELIPCYNTNAMGQYRVPQDVEAEDKILGPFSFRQFVYLMIGVGTGFCNTILRAGHIMATRLIIKLGMVFMD